MLHETSVLQTEEIATFQRLPVVTDHDLFAVPTVTVTVLILFCDEEEVCLSEMVWFGRMSPVAGGIISGPEAMENEGFIPPDIDTVQPAVFDPVTVRSLDWH